MINKIYHDKCSAMNDDDDPAPLFKWNGFFMTNLAGYTCEACGDSLLIEEEKE